MQKGFQRILSLLVWGKGIFSFLITLSIALLLLRQGGKSKQNVVDYLFSSLLYPAQTVVEKVHFRGDLLREKEALLWENGRLAHQLDQLLQAEIENARLREALEFPRREDAPMVLASVVARNLGRQNLSLVIDIGADKGVKQQMPVFTPSGVIGKISKVFSNHSHVQLLGDPASKISVLDNRSRTMGVLETTDSYHFYVHFPAHALIQKGDTIVASGFGGIFPKGMLVGVVSGFSQSDLDVLQKAEVRLTQNPAYLEEVFVLLKEPEWVVGER